MNNFLQRILTGSAFVISIIAAIWWGPILFQGLFLVITLLSLNEYYALISKEEVNPNRIMGFITGTITYLLIVVTSSGNLPIKFLVLLMPIGAILFFAELYRKKPYPFRNIAITIQGVIYCVVPLALLTSLSFINAEYNRGLLLGYFVLLWSSDSFAYVFGNLFGRTRLFERISPKKSWEGSIGGTASTLGVAYLFSLYNPEIPIFHWLMIAVIVSITGTLGDLTESLLKRSLNIKDSGNLLPGHGGALDRFDALLLSIPFVWAYLKLVF